MKNLIKITIGFTLLTCNAIAQFQAIKYQMVVRDNKGIVVSEQNVILELSILQGNSSGTPVCTETFSTITNEFGLVNVEIGSVNPTDFQKINWANGPYFLKVEKDGILMGTSELLSVPYALYAKQSGSGGGSFWSQNSDNIYYGSGNSGGNVGIGTSNPVAKLHINAWGTFPKHVMRLENTNATSSKWDFAMRSNGIYPYLELSSDVSNLLTIFPNGKVGIGTDNPTSMFHVSGDTRLGPNGYFYFHQGNEFNSNDGNLYIQYRRGSDENANMAGNTIINSISGNVGIGTSTPSAKLEVVGHTKTSVLEITGGSDLAEPFPSIESLAPGMVVIIDENNPGHIVASSKAYDKCAAGIVSGAGGVRPGLTLKQDGIMDGTQDIALNGRVYVKATTSNGPIRPGDLLTTSGIPGHAMKATDKKRSFGSVIGKAMSSLEHGEGLVLVLVNLQ